MKAVNIERVQTRRKHALRIAGVVFGALCLSVGSWWRESSIMDSSIENLGLCAIVVGVIGRAWCSLYIGGRKTHEVVDNGPYSISRNPLYLFTYVAVFGVGAQSGSITVALVLTLGIAAIFWFVVRREEQFLSDEFGPAYDRYRDRVPRFGPRFSNWSDQAVIRVRPGRVVRTIADGMFFLMAWPLFEIIEEAREAGIVGTLFNMP